MAFSGVMAVVSALREAIRRGAPPYRHGGAATDRDAGTPSPRAAERPAGPTARDLIRMAQSARRARAPGEE